MITPSIFVSSLALRNFSIQEVVRIAEQNKWNLEFSSGLPFLDTMEDIFLKASITRLPHNYFPSPRDPFVLNLASANSEIRKKSIDMCIHGLELASKANSLFYAAHAGFCIDPSPKQLGQQLDVEQQFDRELHWEIFIKSVKQVLSHAQKLNIPFLIENNVLAKFNLTKNGTNPLLCCDSSEMNRLVNECKVPMLGILLDTAHLKVSISSLNLDADKEMKTVLPVVKAFHHSDNDGLTDTNDKLTENYWCKHFMKGQDNKPHVVEVKDLTIEQVEKQFELLRNFLV